MSENASSPEFASPEVFDPRLTLEQIGDEPQLLLQLVSAYLEQLPRLLPSLADAVQRREAAEIRRAAHALSSATSVIHAPRARAAAQRLEGMGRDGRLDGVVEAHAELVREVETLHGALRRFHAAKSAAA